MIELALNDFGRVHFLFNSAGAALRRSKFLDIDDDLLERTFDLNLKGTFYAMQAVLPHMLAEQVRRHRRTSAAWRTGAAGPALRCITPPPRARW